MTTDYHDRMHDLLGALEATAFATSKGRPDEHRERAALHRRLANLMEKLPSPGVQRRAQTHRELADAHEQHASLIPVTPRDHRRRANTLRNLAAARDMLAQDARP